MQELFLKNFRFLEYLEYNAVWQVTWASFRFNINYMRISVALNLPAVFINGRLILQGERVTADKGKELPAQCPNRIPRGTG